MSRVQRFLDVLDDPKLPALTERDADDELLLTMLVHMFFADGTVATSEVNVLERLLGDLNKDQLSAYIGELGARHLNYDKIAERFPDRGDRDRIVTLAEHGLWGDNVVDSGEVDMLELLMSKLGISGD